MSDESRHLWLGIPQKHHSVPKELEERIGIVMISDSQGHPGIIHITRRLVPEKNIKRASIRQQSEDTGAIVAKVLPRAVISKGPEGKGNLLNENETHTIKSMQAEKMA